MTTPYYRLTVVVCAISWFMVGLHLPTLHQMIDHGRAPNWIVLAILSCFSLIALAGIWILLRAPNRWLTQSGSNTPAT
jgi:hypothetical protein